MIKKLSIILFVLILITAWGYYSFGKFENSSISESQVIDSNSSANVDAVRDEQSRDSMSGLINGNLPRSNENELEMLFFGDLMLDRHVGEKINKYGLEYIFAKISSSSLFMGKDLISANLEGVVTNDGVHYLPDNSYDFAFKPELIDSLKKYNFNFFNIANNHLADQGERGIIETRENLNRLNFNYAGCNDGQVGECSYRKFGIGNSELGMAGFSMVYKRPDIAEMKKIVKILASTTDLVIVNIHWGTEYEHQFNKAQQEVAYGLIDAGADIIIGHHPHVVQGMELYNGKPIFYSLGNFIFDQYFSQDTQEELAVGINWSPDQMEITLLPMRSVGSQPYLLAGEEKGMFFKKFAGWSNVDDAYSQQILDGKIILNF